MNTYIQSISLNSKASELHRLVNESDISVVLSSIERDKESASPTAAFIFPSALSAEEEATLSGIVTAYNDEVGTTKEYKIYNYISEDNIKDKKKVPKEVNYKLLGLYEKEDRTFGEITTKSFYSDYDDVTDVFSNLVVREDYTYNKHANGNVKKRTISIVWIRNDETESDAKKIPRKYSNADAAKHGKDARGHMLEDGKMYTAGLIEATESITMDEAKAKGFIFINKYIDELTEYREGDKFSLINAITNHDVVLNPEDSWLENDIGGGVTIRQVILSKITY